MQSRQRPSSGQARLEATDPPKRLLDRGAAGPSVGGLSSGTFAVGSRWRGMDAWGYLRIAVTTTVVTLVSGATASAARTPIADVTPLSAFGDAVAYSVRDTHGQFRLVFSDSEGTRPVPVPPRPQPFDVDLGPSPNGGPLLTYSRCTAYATRAAQLGEPHGPGRGCRIYVANVSSGRERLVSGTHDLGASEYRPSIWNGNLAFVRKSGSAPPTLWIKRANRPARRLIVGPATTCRTEAGRRRCARGNSEILSTDIRNTQVVAARRYPDLAEGPAYSILLAQDGVKTQTLARVPGGGVSQRVVAWPAFLRSSIRFAMSCFGDPRGCPEDRFGVFTAPLAAPTRVTRIGPLPPTAIWYAPGTSRTSLLLAPSRGTATCREPDLAGCRLEQTG